MAVMPVLHWPDPRLKAEAAPVEAFDDDLVRLVEDMFDTMYDEGGVGLAATQVGVARRVLVMDCGVEDDPRRRVLINPEIVHHEGQLVWPEGCLSFPGIRAEIERSAKLTVRGRDVDGGAVEFSAEGLEAVCVQHEIDHLDGVVFIEHLGAIERAHAMEGYDPEGGREKADDDDA